MTGLDDIVQPCLLISSVWSEIFSRIVANQPSQPGEQNCDDPFYDCDHNELLNDYQRILGTITTGRKKRKKVPQQTLQNSFDNIR